MLGCCSFSLFDFGFSCFRVFRANVKSADPKRDDEKWNREKALIPLFLLFFFFARALCMCVRMCAFATAAEKNIVDRRISTSKRKIHKKN